MSKHADSRARQRIIILAIVMVFCAIGKMQSQIINEPHGKPRNETPRLNVWLDAEGKGDTIELIRVLMVNNTTRPQTVQYDLALQVNETNTKVDQQQGFVETQPGQVKMIAKVPARFLPSSRFRLDVIIYDERLQQVDHDSLVRGQLLNIIQPKTITMAHAEDPDTEIGGLVIDLTKSKQGRDFFEQFYQGYSELPQQAEDNIIVEELPARGTISRISIHINDVLVFQRFLTPRASIVEENAIFAVQVVAQQLQNNGNFSQQLESEDQQGTGIY